MKKLTLLLITLTAVAACGPTKRDPLAKYKMLDTVPREGGKNATKVEYIDREIPVEREKLVEAPKFENKDIKQQFINGQVFEVVHNSNINFTEGTASSFDFSVRILQGEVSFTIDPSALPTGAKIETLSNTVNLAKYRFSWTPKIGQLAGTQTELSDFVRIGLKDIKYVSADAKVNADTKAVFEFVTKFKDIPITLRRENQKPSLRVVGLDGNRKFGQEHTFTVEVSGAGSDLKNPPTLNIVYDLTKNPITARGAEMNGAFYIVENPKVKSPVLQGNKWVYSYIYDTKNLPIQTLFDKSLKPVADARQLPVRATFFVESSNGISDKTTLRFAIDLENTITTAGAE